MISVAIMGHGVVGSGVAEILYTHKQKLFAGVRHLPGVKDALTGKFLLVRSGHTVKEGFLPMNHLIVRDGKNVTFAEGIGQ